MASKVGICNLALRHLGSTKEIANLETEKSQEASALRRFYDQTLQEIFEEFEWPFASKFVTLNLIAEDPTEEWAFSYRMPVDCLKFRRILNGNRNPLASAREPFREAYDASGRLIFADKATAQAEYTVFVDNPSFYPPLFANMAAAKLAMYIAPSITAGDPYKMGNRAAAIYAELKGAALTSAFQGQQDEQVPESSFIAGRDT
jgi:hypothetical protein